MLQLRICPKCGAEIKSKTAYFCYACGKELEMPKASAPKEPHEEPHPKKESISFSVPTLLITFFKAASLAAIVLLLLASIVGISYYYLKNRSKNTPIAPQNQDYIEETFSPLGNVSLGRGTLAELVPTTIDIYIEGMRPEVIIPKIFGGQLEENLESQIGLNLSEAASFLEEKFILFERENPESSPSSEVAFVSKVRDLDFVEKKLEGLPPETSQSATLIGNHLVISNSPTLTEGVERSLRKLDLSLALKTEFAESLRHLPEEGQLLIYLASRNGKGPSEALLRAIYNWVPETLTGNGFIILNEDGKTKVVGEEKELKVKN